jgi:methylated-DNA-[protein]-cysteine S-methyltransferase
MDIATDHIATSVVQSEIGYWLIRADDESIVSIGYCEAAPTDVFKENKISILGKSQLEGYFNRKLKTFDLPLNMASHSAFYQQVWHALATIPFGTAKSYSDLSQMIHNPKAVRAVGMANGKNPFAIVIPCHRIIGKDNSLTGYAAGLEVKRWLLEHEGIFARQTSLF